MTPNPQLVLGQPRLELDTPRDAPCVHAPGAGRRQAARLHWIWQHYGTEPAEVDREHLPSCAEECVSRSSPRPLSLLLRSRVRVAANVDVTLLCVGGVRAIVSRGWSSRMSKKTVQDVGVPNECYMVSPCIFLLGCLPSSLLTHLYRLARQSSSRVSFPAMSLSPIKTRSC